MTPLSLKKRKEERETIGAQRASRLQADTPSPTASRSPMDSPPRHQTPPRRAPRRIVESPDSISPQQPPAGVSSRRRFNGTTPSTSGLQSAAGDGQAGSSPSSPRRSPFFGASFQSLARSSARLFSSGSPSLSQSSALSRLSSPARSFVSQGLSQLSSRASQQPSAPSQIGFARESTIKQPIVASRLSAALSTLPTQSAKYAAAADTLRMLKDVMPAAQWWSSQPFGATRLAPNGPQCLAVVT